MSFSVDLWNGFDIIKSSFTLNIKKLNQLIQILLSYSSYIKDYSKNLMNLYQTSKESLGKEDPILDNSINLLISSFKKESEIFYNHYNFIEKNAKGIKEKIEKLKPEIDKYFNINEQNIEIFNNVLNNLISKQHDFNKSCKEMCLNLAEEEAYKTNEEINGNNNNFLSNLSNNIFNNKNDKKENILKKVLESKNDYTNLITKSNEEREKYNKYTDYILYNLEKNYKDILYNFEYLIRLFIKDKITIHNEISESNKFNKEQTFNKINYLNEVYTFIEKNATKEFPMIELDFIPFKLTKSIIEKQDNDKFNELTKEEQNKIFNNIKKYITNKNINFYENDFSKQFLTNNNKNDKSYTEKNLLKEKEDILKDEKQKNYIESDDEFIVILGKKSKEIIEKKENFNFIKDFIFTLIVEKTDNIKFEYNDIEGENKDNNISKGNEGIKYNQILVKFMALIEPKNKNKYEYLNFFIKYLTINRTKGGFLLNSNVYQIFINIFSYILINYKNSYDYIKNVILLSQTFYKIEDNKKIYLLNGLKCHSVFNEPETWHRAINYSLSISIKNSSSYSLNIGNKDLYLSNLDKIVVNTIISYLYDMKISTNDSIVYEKVKNFYVKVYKLDEQTIEKEINRIITNEEKRYNQFNKIEVKIIDKNENNKSINLDKNEENK